MYPEQKGKRDKTFLTRGEEKALRDVMDKGRSGMVSGKGRREARGSGSGGAEVPGNFYARGYIIKEMNVGNDPAGRMDWSGM